MHVGASNPIDINSTDTFSGFPCNGSIIFQCTVNGSIRRGGSTVWKGTAFSDCEITLQHLRFSRAANTSESLQGQCDNGHMTLIGRSVRVENESYTSQLEVLVKPGHDEIPLKKFNIKCVHDNGSVEIDIGSITINTSVVCMSPEILNDSAGNHTTALKGNNDLEYLAHSIICYIYIYHDCNNDCTLHVESQDLRAILSSGLTLLFIIPVLSIAVPLLLYGLYKKLWSYVFIIMLTVHYNNSRFLY